METFTSKSWIKANQAAVAAADKFETLKFTGLKGSPGSACLKGQFYRDPFSGYLAVVSIPIDKIEDIEWISREVTEVGRSLEVNKL